MDQDDKMGFNTKLNMESNEEKTSMKQEITNEYNDQKMFKGPVPE